MIAAAMAAQQQRLKASQAAVAKNAAPDRKKAEELLRQQKVQIEQALAQLAQVQAMQARQKFLWATSTGLSCPRPDPLLRNRLRDWSS